MKVMSVGRYWWQRIRPGSRPTWSSCRRASAWLVVTASAGLALAGAAPPGRPAPPAHRPVDADPRANALSRFDALAGQAPLDLPPSTQAPDPAFGLPPGPPLRPHELLGFAPYWTLPAAAAFDVTKLSTIAYFGVDCAPDGTVLAAGTGWVGYQSQALTDLITRAHRAGDRVVLTMKCFDRAVLHGIVNDPQATARLASSLIAAIQARRMDGANLDFEGTDGADRVPFARLASAVAQALHGADSRWQVSIDTYASSAGDAAGYFDVAALAPAFDVLHVMAYDMNAEGVAAPSAPLNGYHHNDTDAMAAYLQLVPAGKLLLGTPFYGNDWQTADQSAGSTTTGPPSPLPYSAIAAASHPVYWDQQGSVPWSAYQDAGQHWHQTWFDNAASLALKARLADTDRLLGLGIWALGMEGGDGSLLDALLGGSAALRAALGRHTLGPPPAASPAAAAARPAGSGAASRPAAGPSAAPAGASGPAPSSSPAPPPPPPAPPPPPPAPQPSARPTPTPLGAPPLPTLPPLP